VKFEDYGLQASCQALKWQVGSVFHEPHFKYVDVKMALQPYPNYFEGNYDNKLPTFYQKKTWAQLCF
jgi:hypothetical protein